MRTPLRWKVCYSWAAAFFLSLLQSPCACGQNSSSLNISSMLDGVLKNYDKRVRPNYGGSPVEVGITMLILGISSVSEVDMDFTMDFYFRQFWTDERLAVSSPQWDSRLSVGSEVINQIWIPDTFFANEKKAYFHSATTPNSFLRIGSNGLIIRSMRLTVTGACFMNLRYFPMDSQRCSLEIESCLAVMPRRLRETIEEESPVFDSRWRKTGEPGEKPPAAVGYTAKDVVYKWLKGSTSLGISHDVELSQFNLLGHRIVSKEIYLSTGNYSRLACEFFFVRDMGYYLIQLYIPSGLIVIISWVSFWLNRNASPARVSLGVTTVLTMTTLMTSTNAALPKVSYVKSIDIYLGTCFVLVFAALLEYAAVGYLAKHLEQLERNRPLDFPEALLLKDYTISPSDIDKYSRVAFPVFFLGFNLLYWIIYLQISDLLVSDIIPLVPE